MMLTNTEEKQMTQTEQIIAYHIQPPAHGRP